MPPATRDPCGACGMHPVAVGSSSGLSPKGGGATLRNCFSTSAFGTSGLPGTVVGTAWIGGIGLAGDAAESGCPAGFAVSS